MQAAKAKLETLKSAINDMKMKKALAELTEMASGMIGSIGGSGDTLDRLSEMVNEERDKAAGTRPGRAREGRLVAASSSRSPSRRRWPTRPSPTSPPARGSRSAIRRRRAAGRKAEDAWAPQKEAQ